MLFSEFRQLRMTELMQEQWGTIRMPDLLEVLWTAAPTSVLEIGSFRGVSTEFWALHCRRVVSIDPSPDMAVRRDLHARLAHYPHVKLIEGKSPLQVDEQFDLIYLDGDHSYEMVSKEIDFYKMMEPKWIGGHDYTDTPTLGDGVKLAVDQAFGVPRYRFSDGSWLVNLEYGSKV